MAGRVSVGVDLGGTSFACALVDETGRTVAQCDGETKSAEGAESVLGRIGEAVVALREKAGLSPGDLLGIGMGVPGLIDAERGIALFSPNLKWRDVQVAEIVGRRTGLPVYIDNDVRVAVWGERTYGAGREVDVFILITLGTGIGGGLFLGGRIWRGAAGYAGEVGHQSITADGPLCGCGNRGCVEAWAGTAGILRRARAMLAESDDPRAHELYRLAGGDIAAITPAMIHRAAVAGDAGAARVLADTGRFVGTAMANLVNVLNPERIIVGGGIARAGDYILEPMRQEIVRRGMDAAARMVEVVPAELGEAAGYVGASTLPRLAG
ncbi:MAG TPA: ROK family protein [Limnochordia bacterium]|nr:ROK family protein [Limnochordia bacterium]